MPYCERCARWFPSRLGVLHCTVCGGSVRSTKDDPAFRDSVRLIREHKARELGRIRELKSRPDPLTPEEQAECDTLLDQYAARQGKWPAEIDEKELRQPVADGGLGPLVVIFPLMGLAALWALLVLFFFLYLGLDWRSGPDWELAAFAAFGVLFLPILGVAVALEVAARLVAAFRGKGQRPGRRRA